MGIYPIPQGPLAFVWTLLCLRKVGKTLCNDHEACDTKLTLKHSTYTSDLLNEIIFLSVSLPSPATNLNQARGSQLLPGNGTVAVRADLCHVRLKPWTTAVLFSAVYLIPRL